MMGTYRRDPWIPVLIVAVLLIAAFICCRCDSGGGSSVLEDPDEEVRFGLTRDEICAELGCVYDEQVRRCSCKDDEDDEAGGGE